MKKHRILFFIDSLRAGGKERRLIELLSYLKRLDKYEMLIVITKPEIQYPRFFDLNIKYICIEKKPNKKNFNLFFFFYKICKNFKPHIIHVWGNIPAFYSIPTKLILRIPLINSQITSSPPGIKRCSLYNITNQINFMFSNLILSNSKAGIQAFHAPLHKSRVVYNGVNLNRFRDLPSTSLIKEKYNIQTSHVVIMVANFTKHKNHALFVKVAKYTINKKDDLSFIGVGGLGDDHSIFNNIKNVVKNNPRILLPGKINNVEALVNASDIGVLFTNTTIFSEGISNAILEYMALGKPVIANNDGGTKEVIEHNISGFLIKNESVEEIGNMIIDLIDNKVKRNKMGQAGQEKIKNCFTIEKMGKAFEEVYSRYLPISVH